jgi:hypothetical protein
MLWLIAGVFPGDFQFVLLAGEGVLPCQISFLFESDFHLLPLTVTVFCVTCSCFQKPLTYKPAGFDDGSSILSAYISIML